MQRFDKNEEDFKVLGERFAMDEVAGPDLPHHELHSLEITHEKVGNSDVVVLDEVRMEDYRSENHYTGPNKVIRMHSKSALTDHDRKHASGLLI